MGKSEMLFAGYCETLRQMFDNMSDEEFEAETANEHAREMLASIGYKRNEKKERHEEIEKLKLKIKELELL